MREQDGLPEYDFEGIEDYPDISTVDTRFSGSFDALKGDSRARQVVLQQTSQSLDEAKKALEEELREVRSRHSSRIDWLEGQVEKHTESKTHERTIEGIQALEMNPEQSVLFDAHMRAISGGITKFAEILAKGETEDTYRGSVFDVNFRGPEQQMQRFSELQRAVEAGAGQLALVVSASFERDLQAYRFYNGDESAEVDYELAITMQVGVIEEVAVVETKSFSDEAEGLLPDRIQQSLVLGGTALGSIASPLTWGLPESSWQSADEDVRFGHELVKENAKNGVIMTHEEIDSPYFLCRRDRIHQGYRRILVEGDLFWGDDALKMLNTLKQHRSGNDSLKRSIGIAQDAITGGLSKRQP